MGSPENQAAFHEALRTAHALVAQGQPLQALRVGVNGQEGLYWWMTAPTIPSHCCQRCRLSTAAAAGVQVVAELLQALGLEREAGESIARWAETGCR